MLAPLIPVIKCASGITPSFKVLPSTRVYFSRSFSRQRDCSGGICKAQDILNSFKHHQFLKSEEEKAHLNKMRRMKCDFVQSAFDNTFEEAEKKGQTQFQLAFPEMNSCRCAIGIYNKLIKENRWKVTVNDKAVDPEDIEGTCKGFVNHCEVNADSNTAAFSENYSISSMDYPNCKKDN